MCEKIVIKIINKYKNMVQSTTMLRWAAQRIPMIRFRAGAAPAVHQTSNAAAAASQHSGPAGPTRTSVCYIAVNEFWHLFCIMCPHSIHPMPLKIGNYPRGSNANVSIQSKWNILIEVDRNSGGMYSWKGHRSQNLPLLIFIVSTYTQHNI